MTSEGEVFKGDSADISAGKFPLVLMGGRANGQAWTPIGASGNLNKSVKPEYLSL